MPNYPKIRAYYRPLQPAIRHSTGGVAYREFIPPIDVQPFIYCYWQLQTQHVLNHPFHYRVVADGCIDIFWERHAPQSAFIMGFCRKYTVFPLAAEFDYFGIRFLPGMFTQLFSVAADELSDMVSPLAQVLPAVANFIQTTYSTALDTSLLQQQLDTYFSQVIQTTSFDFDPRFYDALLYIMKNQGVVAAATDLQTGVSPRQLRRLFNQYVGTSPKTFSKIVRFQHILNAKPSQQSLRQNPLFYDVGYYDQAHFIKDFKTLYGVTPTEAFGRER